MASGPRGEEPGQSRRPSLRRSRGPAPPRSGASHTGPPSSPRRTGSAGGPGTGPRSDSAATPGHTPGLREQSGGDREQGGGDREQSEETGSRVRRQGAESGDERAAWRSKRRRKHVQSCR